jgi:hypothetical protein
MSLLLIAPSFTPFFFFCERGANLKIQIVFYKILFYSCLNLIFLCFKIILIYLVAYAPRRQKVPTTIPQLWCDNLSSIALALNPVFHTRAKHTKVKVNS